MASTANYSWNTWDNIWTVAARYMQQAGYKDISSFVAAIRQANLGANTANITDWQAVAAGTIITLPHSAIS